MQIAGPAAILSFAASAFICFTVAMALGELASAHPAAGSFGVYGELYLNPFAGFLARKMEKRTMAMIGLALIGVAQGFPVIFKLAGLIDLSAAIMDEKPVPSSSLGSARLYPATMLPRLMRLMSRRKFG